MIDSEKALELTRSDDESEQISGFLWLIAKEIDGLKNRLAQLESMTGGTVTSVEPARELSN